MTSDRILLARHGKTLWNSQGRRQGQLDSPLLTEGWEHARSLAALARRREIDAIFTSPLGRAHQTAEVCADALGVDLTIIDELAELHHGAMAGLTESEIREQYPGQLDERQRNKYHWRFPGGESYADVHVRAGAALDKVVRDHRPCRPLIVSHEMIGRMLVKNLLDMSPGDALTLQQPHDVVFEVALASGTSRTLSTLSTSS